MAEDPVAKEPGRYAERDGGTFYFCRDLCRQKFLSTPAGAKAEDGSRGCCGWPAHVSVARRGSAAVARYRALINLILAAFNLVPAFPMDGGRVLGGALWGSEDRGREQEVNP